MSATVPHPQERRQDAAVLAVIVLVGAVFMAIWALRVPGWSVMTDELLYVKLALHIGDTLSPLPAVHGQSFSQFTPVYPLVLAPLYGWLSTPTAFALAHALNCLLMASAAIPAFLLARDAGVSRLGAYLAAALTVAAPWTVYSFFVMTEALAYPVFVWAALACVRAVARPSWRGDVVAIAGIAVAVLTRTQFVVLALALPAAVVVHELSRELGDRARGGWRHRLLGGGRSVVREHLPLVACGVIGLVVVGGLAVTGGVGRATGNYHVLFAGNSVPPGTLSGVRPHLLLLVVGVGVVPFLAAVAWTLAALAAPRDKDANALAAFIVIAVPAVLLVTAAFNRRQLGALVQDRYAFYVVPLLFVATGAYLFGRPRGRWPLAVSALVTVWVLAGFSAASHHAYSYVDSPHRVLKGWIGKVAGAVGLASPGVAVVLCAATLLAVALLAWPKGERGARLVPMGLAAATLAFCVAESVYNLNAVLGGVRTQLEAFGVHGHGSRDWVDRAVPSGATVAIVPGVVGDLKRSQGAWWDVEFWNSAITQQYDYTPSFDATPFPKRSLALDWGSGALAVAGPPVNYFVLPAADRRFEPRGQSIARRDGLVLVRAAPPLRAAWAVRGTNTDGWTFAGRPATIRLFGSAGNPPGQASVSVQLTSTPDVSGPRAYRLTGGERTVTGTLAPNHQAEVAVAACVRADRPTDLGVAVKGTSTLPSGEQVGLAVTGVRVVEGGSCPAA
jgi:hypothetical protein